MSEWILPSGPEEGGSKGDLASLIKAFSTSAQSTNRAMTVEGLTRLQRYLSGKTLRYFVYRSSGFGHQANTVNLLKRMIALGFTNDVEMVYDTTDGSQVIDKLAVLLPGLAPANPTPYLLNGVKITFCPYKEAQGKRTVTGLSGQAPICINGGAEIANITHDNLAKALQVDFYIQLQPYMWEVVNTNDNPLSLILPASADAIIDLAKEASLQGREFCHRAFSMPTPMEPDWAQLQKIPNIHIATIERAKAVVDLALAQTVMTFPVYGLYDAPLMRKPVIAGAAEVPFVLASACALTQKTQKSPFNKPIIMSLLNTLSPDTFEQIRSYFPVNGEPLMEGDLSEMEQEEKIAYYTQRWCAQRGLLLPNEKKGLPGNIHIKPDISATDLNALVTQLNNHGVIIINLPNLPQDLFNYLYEIAALPAVFEGQGTANLALNLGKPFFKLMKSGDYPYPTMLGESAVSDIPEKLRLATYRDIQLGIYEFKSGYAVGKQMPPDTLAELLQQMAKDYAVNGLYRQYFDELKASFTDNANDKLLQALAFLTTRFDLGRDRRHQIALHTENNAQTPLEQLHDRIKSTVDKNALGLFPSVISSGPLFDFITGVLPGNTFTIGSVQISYPDPKERITVSGQTLNFLGVSLRTAVIFTMNKDGQTIDAAFELTVGDLNLDAVPWFTLDDVVIHAVIPGNGERITGSVASNIKIGESPIAFSSAFPTSAEGKIVIAGDLSAEPPSLNDLFALLGGMNFMNTLPAQINDAGNITLQQLKFGYDYATPAIDAFELALRNDKEWTLFPGLTLENLEFNIGVLKPTGARTYSWQAKTQVALGSTRGIIDVSASYPDLTVSANMADDSPEIPLGDLITFFLPDSYRINLHANLANFAMTVVPGEQETDAVYNISAGINLTAWELSLGSATFSLTNLSFNIEGTGAGTPTGTLSATTALFSEQPDIAVNMSVTASYVGQGAWSFEGKQGNSAIKVKQIIQTYLGTGWWVDGMPNLDISELNFKVESEKNKDEATNPDAKGSAEKTTAEGKAIAWMVGGKITVWDTPLGDDFQSVITAKFGVGTEKEKAVAELALQSTAWIPVLNDSGAIVPMQAKPLMLAANDGEATPYGHVSAQIVWNNIDLTLFYNYDKNDNAYGFFWGPLSAKIDSKTHIATLKFTDSTSLGAMVEMFVSWLTGSRFGLAAPWNALNDITLSNFALEWNFKEDSVKFSVDIGPLDLLFAKVTGFTIEYQPKGENQGVQVALAGDFLWLEGSNKGLSWNAADPASTPAPPGGGNKYLELRLLAAGQHIQIPGLQNITSVQQAIKLLAELPVPDGESVPAIGFDAGNNWLFATDFGVLKIEDKEKDKATGTALATLDRADKKGSGYVFTLQIVFTDPTLYALRIALEGEAAKVFAGLDFQVIYRKLSPGLGVFQAVIVLPTQMRRIDVGAYTLTLPTFGVEIYTNGDFKFDIGFPWNENFSGSFSIEAIIPPGIPALGSGGFYFGKLPAIVVSQLPVATNGFFNPNLVFGFGAQIGIGKSLDVGVLKAGFSLTVFGIIEGILAKWNPYEVSNTGSSNALTMEGQYYFWLQGTFGIIGHIYGSIDFVIIKASVDINLKLYAQITLASYSPIPISVCVSVSVSAKAEINLGLFKIAISFSFSTHIQQSFTLGYLQNPNDAPWKIAAKSDHGRLLTSGVNRFRLCQRNMTPQWDRLLAGAGNRQTLNGCLGFAPGIAGDDVFNSPTHDLKKQLACYVVNLFIDAPGAATQGRRADRLRAAGEDQDTSFEKLAKMVARWAVSAMQSEAVTPEVMTPEVMTPEAMTPEQIDRSIVTDEMLTTLIDYLSDSEENPMPLSVNDIEQFIRNQFKLIVSLPTKKGEVDATYFPMAGGLNIRMPGYGEQPEINYTFAEYNAVSDDFVMSLRDYFNQLAVQVQQESEADRRNTVTCYHNQALSVASFIFSDYFVLIMRQMLQVMRDGLRDFNYAPAAGDTGNTIVDWVNDTGELHTARMPFTLYDLFKGNESHPLTVGKKLMLPLVSYTLSATDSFTHIAALSQFGGAFDAAALAVNNADVAGILAAGATVTYAGRPYLISGSETLIALAGRVGGGVTLGELLVNSDILTQEKLFQPNAMLTLPPFVYTTVAGDTLHSVATAQGITVADLAGVDRDTETSPIGTLNGEIADLFEAVDGNNAPLFLDLVQLPQFQVAALLAEAQRVNAINHLSGMTSRYYFHGLRLPTDKITPKKRGMWVAQDPQSGALSLPAYAGLFALTGQQLPLRELPTKPLAITLSKGSEIDWLAFANGESSLTFTVEPTANDLNYQRIAALNHYATSTILPAGPTRIDSAAVVKDETTRYPLTNGIRWQSRQQIVFPSGEVSDQTRIWPLPYSMLALSDLGRIGQDAPNCPDFALESVRMNVATGSVEETAVERVAWASAIEFTVKKLVVDSRAGNAWRYSYEIMGASANDTVMLERIVQYVRNDASFASMVVGYQSASSSAGTTFSADTGESVTFGISQTNLSTVTRPPQANMMLANAEINSNILNKPTELVRLLWEASITRSGGFFLYYFDAESGAGLPDAAFNDKGEATLSLIILYTPQPRLQPYMNAVVTGEPLDTAGSTLVAKTRSQKVTHTVQAGDSLASIVSRYLSNLISLVENSGDIALVDGAQLAVNNGVYRVPVNGGAPGGQLSAIATWYSMTPDAIKTANPRITGDEWNKGLPNGTVIRLPATRHTVCEKTGGMTLTSIAAWYGTSVMALAADNAMVSPLLSVGQKLMLMTGPLSQFGTQVPGVQAIQATRDGLPAIPSDPGAPAFAEDLLLNNFTLLAYQIQENADFSASHIGLPLGPQSESSSVGDGKVRFIRELTRADDLTYSTSIPYTQFARKSTAPANPYSANGRLLQIGYTWNDLYGNRIFSTLDDIHHPHGAANYAPKLTGYTDTLLTMAQWPSVSTSWSVADTHPAGEQFLIQLTSAFDCNAFNPTEDDVSDAWIARARSSLQTLNAILNQLNDPNGIALYVDCTLLCGSMPIDPAQIGRGEHYAESDTLTGWLVAIRDFLAKRANGNRDANEPAQLSYVLSVTAEKQAVNQANVFPLTLSVTIKRTGGVAQGDFAAVESVMSASMNVAAKTDIASGRQQNVLQGFARDIGDTLSQPGQFTLVVAQGSDRYLPAAGISQSSVWAMRVGVNGSGKGIAWRVNDTGQPELFAPMPVSNTLVTRNAQIFPYNKLTDFDPVSNSFNTAAIDNTWSGIDMDTWLSSFFNFFDTLFSPEYTSSMLVIDARATNKPVNVESFLTALAEQKKALAQMAAALMAPVYATQRSSRLDSAREALRQNLLVKLSNFYTVRAAISFGATVEAAIAQREDEQDPQLFCNLSWNSDNAELESLVTLTSPKVALVKGDNQPVTFLMSVPGNIKVNGEVVQSVTLDLSCAGTAVEHQVSALPGIDDYLASSWLSPICTDDNALLTHKLGAFTVPLILRDRPATPRMMSQSGTATHAQATELSQLTQWTYRYTYSVDFHYEQDVVYHVVRYNLKDSDALSRAGYMAAFQGLAQFIASQKTLSQLIGQTVPQIDAQTTDQGKINEASLALGAYLKMVTDIVNQASGTRSQRVVNQQANRSLGRETWRFRIAEKSATVHIGSQDRTVWVVMLTSEDDKSLTGMSDYPAVQIAGYRSCFIPELSDPDSRRYAWYYQDERGEPLTADVAQSLAARTVELPGMQILERQDAISTVYLTRNEDIGGKIDEHFVFTTPEVSFGNPLHPTLRSSQQVNIAMLGTRDGRPRQRMLAEHLSALFNALFEDDFSINSTLQVNVTYVYSLASALTEMPVSLPLAVMPPLEVGINERSDNTLSLKVMVETLSEAITTWAQVYRPSEVEAYLAFEVTIMSNLTVNPMPLLELSNLVLPVQYIVPALKL